MDDHQPGDARSILNDNLRNAFGRVVYSHKTHEKAREIESNRSVWTKWVNIILVTATSGALFSTVITYQKALLYISAALSALALAFAIFQLSFDPDSSAGKHRQAARDLWYLREKYLNLLTDLAIGMDLSTAASRRDHLTQEANGVYSHAPGTSSRAYRAAQKALKVDEEMYFSEEELDALLPSTLKMGA